jgi:hypothetical protein
MVTQGVIYGNMGAINSDGNELIITINKNGWSAERK